MEIQLDRAVISKLPPGSEVLAVTISGRSAWVDTVKIVIRLEDGTATEYFKKGASGKVGYGMMRGAFEAEQALYAFVSSRVPRPVAWGTYADDTDTHFYICEFVEMLDIVPSPNDWAAAVSALHLNSMGKSPTGQFGFHVTTHLANVPVDNTWNGSWQRFWRQQMKSLFDQEDCIYGLEDEMTALKKGFLDKVIPRYLGPLESDGRSVKPCLIHSDCWNIYARPVRKPRVGSGG